ncbi:MAG TPA: LLM class flavin-dependent oxidoreductase, partial [Thermomicrobiales bacterium]|nr:LLM class flavin-dependent oxidoreductase [Thermomicrobiales bacterium]
RGPRPEGIPIHVACQGARMMDLTARHADGWNTAWFGPVDGIAPRREAFERACEQAGREPSSIKVTVGVHVAAPELVPGEEFDPAKALIGSPDDIARAFAAYEVAGVSHIICGALADMSYDYTSRVMEKTGEALRLYRG